MNIKTIDERFATTGQVRPEEIAALAAQGYAAIVCARPDHEDPDQPSFADIARAAEKHGMKAIHIPVTGQPTPDQVVRFGEAMAAIDGSGAGLLPFRCSLCEPLRRYPAASLI